MPIPDIKLTFRDGGTGDSGDPYTGLDRFGRLVETLWKQDTGERVRSSYGRNRVGGVVWRRDDEAHAQSPVVDNEDNYYWYDRLQQVKERQRGNLTGTAPDYTGIDNLQQEEDWTYDATGNWTSYSNPSNASGDTQTRIHNTANEITEISATAGDVNPIFDPTGNMLTLPKEPGISTEQYDLVWDAWNRLVAVRDGSTMVASYTYDGQTRRLTKTTADEVRHYYYNHDWRTLEERVEGASAEVDRQYVWGLRDRWDLLRRKRSTSGVLDETLYVLRDYLDPVAVVDDSGNVIERYAYDAFGNVRFLAPDYSDRTNSGFDWDFLFHAEFRDSVTKLFNYGHRYYDPALGRWLSRDYLFETLGAVPESFPEVVHLYGFVSNNPMNWFDDVGLATKKKPKDPFKIAFKGAGGIDPNGQWAAFTSNIFASKDWSGGVDAAVSYFDKNNDKKLDAKDCPPFRIRVVGYSWGGWSAIIFAQKMGDKVTDPVTNLKIAIGTLDPVKTLRSGTATLPQYVKSATNIFQKNGCYQGCPGAGRWYRGQSIPGANETDLTSVPYGPYATNPPEQQNYDHIAIQSKASDIVSAVKNASFD
jgi:RHS repeat-associated protein